MFYNFVFILGVWKEINYFGTKETADLQRFLSPSYFSPFIPDASLAPSSVNATHVSPTSAKIEWLPGNSSFSHDIFVNDAYQRTIRPGTYQHTLTNLEPDQDYRVTVRARNPKQLTDHEGGRAWEIGDPMASETEFRTDPGGTCSALTKRVG